jgi:hypothetical protein
MPMLTALGSAIPLAFASGLNVYATVAVLGLCAHYQLVALPEQFRAFDNPIVIGVALTMFVVEFVADKIPWFDTVWDASTPSSGRSAARWWQPPRSATPLPPSRRSGRCLAARWR